MIIKNLHRLLTTVQANDVNLSTLLFRFSINKIHKIFSCVFQKLLYLPQSKKQKKLKNSANKHFMILSGKSILLYILDYRKIWRLNDSVTEKVKCSRVLRGLDFVSWTQRLRQIPSIAGNS